MEREAMEDPFLQGAIDGYDSVEGDHYSAIQKLEQQLTRPRKRVNKRVWIAAAAALLLLLIGIPFLLYPPQPTAEPLVATTDTRMEKETVKGRTAEEETVEEKTVEEETEEKQVVEEKSVEEKSKTLDEIVVVQASEESKELKTIRTTGTTEITGATKETEEREAFEIAQVAETTEITKVTAEQVGLEIAQATEAIEETESRSIPTLALAQRALRSTITDTQAMDQSAKKEAKGITVKGFETKGFETKAFETKAFSRKDVKTVVSGEKEYTTQESGKKDTETAEFGEKEFKEFFVKHYDKSLCQGDSIAFTVTFFIRSDGRPTGIQMQKNSCSDLETEIKRLLLGSPLWTNTNIKVTLTVEIPGS